ncbi:hypothetical protein N0V83_007325 [Neocucurbitaria cava]|uniref:Uncharacterized protein n=1 Tax=Neocucurbitaria cava TaxID=798079 RepID=A0A9W9CJB3_9PLEO|nr:hypothetical protein N0V83_007325 [Neocucurbitaria cava]
MSSQLSTDSPEQELESPPDDMPKPFRFLDLPKDIRLMVYEQLPYTRNFHNIPLRDLTHHLTIVNPSVSGIRILATCRLINEEASYVLGPRMQHILQRPPKIIIEGEHLIGLMELRNGFTWYKDILDKICNALHLRGYASFIHQYRKGQLGVEKLRTRLQLGIFLEEGDDEEIVKALASFILRTRKWMNSKPKVEWDLKYPPITVVIAIPPKYHAPPVITTTSTAMFFFYRLMNNTPQSRTQTGVARLTWLVANLARKLVTKSKIARSVSFVVKLQFGQDGDTWPFAAPDATESKFRAAVEMGVSQAAGAKPGLVIYGGVAEVEGEGDEGFGVKA